MNERNAEIFAQKRFITHSKKLFLKVLEYVVFCYIHLKNDNEHKKVYYSIDYCKKHTKFKFEDYLKRKFVNDYLQNLKNHFHYSEIQRIDFQYETEKDYEQGGIKASDKIDIFISNLGLKSNWCGIKREDSYFAIECKRLKNTSYNSLYIADIQKFVERAYNFRFPFETMIGFVEKSSITIDEIINDMNSKLENHPVIKTTKKLIPFQIQKNFNKCRLSEHKKKIHKTILIKIYHLFFDYSKIIID